MLAIILGISSIILPGTNFNTTVHGQELPKPVKLVTVVWAPHFFSFLAREKGFFEKNHVDVQLKIIPDYTQAIKSYEDGDYDGIFEVYSDAITQQSNGIDTKVVYNTDLSDTGDVLVGKLNNLTEVRGKTVSVEGINSYSHFFLIRALQSAGLGEEDIQLINLPATNVSSALDKSEISAGYTYEPYTQDALKKGYKIIFKAGIIPGTISDVIAFHSDFVSKRPDAVRAILLSFAEAQKYYNDNKDESIRIMSALTGVSKQEMAVGLHASRVLNLRDNYFQSMKNSTQSSSLYNSGQYIGKFLLERGQIGEYPPLDSMIEPRFVTDIFRTNPDLAQMPSANLSEEKSSGAGNGSN
jgi:NitT/TauT family transport system substrate-binding protein